MTDVSPRDAVLRILGRIAPEVDGSTLDPDRPLREQIDIDSMDFLNFVIGLHKELGVEIPEPDYHRLSTLRKCVEYLSSRLAPPPPPPP